MMRKRLALLLSILLLLLTGCSLFTDNEPDIQQDTIDYFSQWYTDTTDLTFKEYSKSYNGYNFMLASPKYTVELHIIYNDDGKYSGVYEVKELNGEKRKVIESYPITEVTNEVIKLQIKDIEKTIPTSILFFKQYDSNYYEIRSAKIDYFDEAMPVMAGQYNNQNYFENISVDFISLIQTESIKNSFNEILLSNKSTSLYMEDRKYNTEHEGPYTSLSFHKSSESKESIKIGYPSPNTRYDADLMIIESPVYQIN